MIDAARVSLIRIALAFGLANAVVPFLLQVASPDDPTSLGLAFAWVVAWGIAVLNPHRLLALLQRDRTRWAVAVIGGGATLLTIVATGGLDSPVKTGANWLGWAATVVVPARTALVFASVLSVATTGSFVLSGTALAELVTGDDRYIVITGFLNPFVIVLVALSLLGAFHDMIARAPTTLWEVRRGGPATTPAMTALFAGAPIPLLETGGDRGEEERDPETTASQEAGDPGQSAALGARTEGVGSAEHQLFPVEREIVALLASGRTPQQIALDLERSTDSIYGQIASAKRKAGARTIEHLVALAWEPVA